MACTHEQQQRQSANEAGHCLTLSASLVNEADLHLEQKQELDVRCHLTFHQRLIK
jgi:hypothetical protein